MSPHRVCGALRAPTAPSRLAVRPCTCPAATMRVAWGARDGGASRPWPLGWPARRPRAARAHCPRRNPPVLAVSYPARPCKNAMQNRVTLGKRYGCLAAPGGLGRWCWARNAAGAGSLLALSTPRPSPSHGKTCRGAPRIRAPRKARHPFQTRTRNSQSWPNACKPAQPLDCEP